eukprot:340627-Hanusia_phi.AAC.4
MPARRRGRKRRRQADQEVARGAKTGGSRGCKEGRNGPAHTQEDQQDSAQPSHDLTRLTLADQRSARRCDWHVCDGCWRTTGRRRRTRSQLVLLPSSLSSVSNSEGSRAKSAAICTSTVLCSSRSSCLLSLILRSDRHEGSELRNLLMLVKSFLNLVWSSCSRA